VRVAYLSPLPPGRSGIADYSALLLPELARRADVAVVRPRSRRPPRADVALYHVGNDPEARGWIVDALRKQPGVVVLHDFVLHHLVAGLTLGRGDGNGYLDALEREGGVPGRLLAHGVIDGRMPPLWESRPEDFPLTREVLGRAEAVIVHSRHVEERVRSAGFRRRVFRVPHPAWPVSPVEPAAVAGEPLVGCFGHLNASKRIPEVLEAFARLRSRRPAARLLLVGALAPRFRLAERVRRLGLEEDALVYEGYVDERRLWSPLAACDICANLRHPTTGETSGAALRPLSLGRPLVVSETGWFSELPDDVALKIPADRYEVDTLDAALELLAARRDVRSRLAENARCYAAREHEFGRVTEAYFRALEVAAGGEAVDEAVLLDLSSAAADTGLGDGELRRLAGLATEIGVGA